MANAVGPFAAIWEVWTAGAVGAHSGVPIWALLLGGGGIVLGLATYGYNIMRALGVKMVKVSSVRGDRSANSHLATSVARDR